MAQRVIHDLKWRTGNWDDSSVHDLHADYAYVPDTADLGQKADLTYVNNRLSSIENDTQTSISTIRQQTEASIAALQQSFQKALASKDRIESEKKELTLLFETLTSNIKDECLKIENQLSAEIKAYKDIDKALNDKIELLLGHKKEFVDAKDNAAAIIQELTKQIAVAEKVKDKLENPNKELLRKVKDITLDFYLLLVNIIILDGFLIKWLFF